ncbi:hypothetical protein DVW05_04835 [Clostridium botulinum]|nr:hypothetical protein [Clostridium botulinum]MBN1054672.1 hypothetical protein [Clostridium botulinum]
MIINTGKYKLNSIKSKVDKNILIDIFYTTLLFINFIIFKVSFFTLKVLCYNIKTCLKYSIN